MTGVIIHDSNPFGDLPEGARTADERPAVDVSSDAMTRLRTPFEVETESETSRSRDDHGQRR